MAAHDRGCLPILGARERDLLRVDDQPGRGPPAAPCASGARRLVCLVALIVEGVAVTPLPLPIDGVDRLSSLCFPAFPHCIGVQALPGRCSWDCDRDPDGENDWSCVEGTHPSQKGRSFNPPCGVSDRRARSDRPSTDATPFLPARDYKRIRHLDTQV